MPAFGAASPPPAMKTALVNGREQATVGINDRGLLYGDGIFETIAIRDQAPCHWSAHVQRLMCGAERLGIPCPDAALLRAEADALAHGVEHGVLRLTLTRGEGGRGYRPSANPTATRILARYPSPPYGPDATHPGAELLICRTQLGDNPQLAGIKHLNRLEQVLARSEWDDPGIIDGVMTDRQGRVICGTMSNLFLLFDDGIATPVLDRCGVAGTARAVVMDCAAALGIPVVERDVPLAELARARGLFVTNALLGLLPVVRLGARRYDPTAVPSLLPSLLVEQVRRTLFQPEKPW
jgi:4-amino-4-deoxychorismate lyase